MRKPGRPMHTTTQRVLNLFQDDPHAIDENALGATKHECPECGFKW